MTHRKFRKDVAFLSLVVMASSAFVTQTLLVGSSPEPRVDPATVPLPIESSWPMFGGSLSRNMVNLTDHNVPTDWVVVSKETDKGRVTDFALSRNLKWVAKLGYRSYGGPVVAGGQVYVGTNNESPRDPRVKGDRGILMCFRASNGEFLWQAVHDKHAGGLDNDWPKEGLVSAPTVEDDRLYYVSNRGEVICASTRPRSGTREANILWTFDMWKLGVYPHNMSSCSPLVVGERVFVNTSNGVDDTHMKVAAPQAPSFLALRKRSGQLLWQDNSPGTNIMHGQWSNPTYAHVRGQAMVIFPGGDGWIRAFDPISGGLLWKFDGNPKDSKYELGGKGTRSEFIATAVVWENKLYITNGQDPEHYAGVANLWCIDLARAVEHGRRNLDHDVSPVNDNFDPRAPINQASALAWHFGGPRPQPAERDYYIGRSLSTCAVHDGLVYAAELAGYLHCIDARTGKEYWTHDLKAAVWGSPYWVDGKVYITSEDGDVWIFPHGKEKVEPKKIEMEQPFRSTPVVVDGVLYLMTESHLYAISNK